MYEQAHIGTFVSQGVACVWVPGGKYSNRALPSESRLKRTQGCSANKPITEPRAVCDGGRRSLAFIIPLEVVIKERLVSTGYKSK